MQAIKTEHLRKEYRDVTAVEDLNLQVAQGELFSLLGVNGAGKTTTIRMLSCLCRPTSGEALLGGKSIVRDTAAVKAMIGVSPQETAVAPNLTVRENLELMCGVHGFSKEKSRQKVTALSAQFGLDAVLKKKAGRLSGGWQRRLSIAMALISKPKVLFLDEPTTYLDIAYQEEILDLLTDLNKKRNTTILMVLHDINLAGIYCDSLIMLKDGQVIAAGNTNECLCEENLKKLYDISFFHMDTKKGQRYYYAEI